MMIKPITKLHRDTNFCMLRINKEDADILMALPKSMLDSFDKQLMNAPQDLSRESSLFRDNLILNMIEKAKIHFENLRMEVGE